MLLETLFFGACYIVLSQTEFEYCTVLLCSKLILQGKFNK